MLGDEEGPDVLRHAARGVTLIELIVTIALAATLVTLSIPSFVAWVRNAQIRSVADSLQNGLRVAQAEALRRNRQVVLGFTNDTPAAGTNPFASATAVAGGRRWWLQTVPQVGETSSDVSYIAAGVVVDGASTVTIANDQSARTVCFGSTGRLVTNTSITGLSSGSCTAAKTTFTVDQPPASTYRTLKVIVQLGGQVRMCDPARPALSSASPEGC